MSAGIILLLIGVGVFVLLSLAVAVYCKMEDVKKSWKERKYIETILNISGFIMMILGFIIPKQNYLCFIGLCVMVVAGIIEVVRIAKHREDSESSN